MVVKLGQGVVFRPGTAFDERWAPNQYLSGFVTSIFGDDASIVVFPDVYAPFYEMRVKRDDSLSEERTWTPAVGENQTMPEAPSDGQIYGRRNQAWTPISGEDQGFLQAIIISDVAPPAVLTGLAWFDTTINNFYVAEQGKWIEPAHVNPPEEISVNISPPFLSGIVGLGYELTCHPGDWTSNPSSYLFQWRRNDLDIVGSTLSTYTIVSADINNTLSCAVTALNVIGVSQVAVSNSVSVTAPTNTLAPLITGTVALGQVFSCSNGAWSTSSSIESYAYQWYRTGVAIAGETTSTHTLVAADVSTDLTCTVIATNAVGASLPATSNSVPIRVPAIREAPVITGQVMVGAVLSCTTGFWTSDPTSYSYQWIRGVAPISGATANTYTIVSADVNNKLTCQVIATNPMGPSLPATSANEYSISAPVIDIPPVISGALYISAVVSCSTGIWIGLPTSYTYRWKRNGANIPGATSNTYQLTISEFSTNLTCDVTATNGIGSSAPVSSNTLAIPAAATLDPATVLAVTLSVSNWQATHIKENETGGARSASFKNSGKWLAEFTVDLIGEESGCGFLADNGTYLEMLSGKKSVMIRNNAGQIWINGQWAGAAFGGLNNALVQWAIDLDNKLVWCRVAGDPQGWNNDVSVKPGVTGGLPFGMLGPTTLFSPAVCFGGLGNTANEVIYCQFGQGGVSFTVPGFAPGWSG